MSSHSASKWKLILAGSIALVGIVVLIVACPSRSIFEDATRPSSAKHDVPTKVIDIDKRGGSSADMLSDLKKVSKELRFG